jgi:hypothetical protein
MPMLVVKLQQNSPHGCGRDGRLEHSQPDCALTAQAEIALSPCLIA